MVIKLLTLSLLGVSLWSFSASASTSMKEYQKGDVGEHGCPNEGKEKVGAISVTAPLVKSSVEDGKESVSIGITKIKMKAKFLVCEYKSTAGSSTIHFKDKYQIGVDWRCVKSGKDYKCHKRRGFTVTCPSKINVNAEKTNGWEGTGSEPIKLSDLDWHKGAGRCQYGKEKYSIHTRNDNEFKKDYPFHCDFKSPNFVCKENYGE